MGYTFTEFVNMFMTLFAILVLGVILRFTLKNRTLAIRQIPLHIIGATLITIEIVKQIYHIFVGDWNTWCLPLHICSFFLIWYGMALFTRGKFRQLMYFCSLTGGIMVSVVMFCAPRIILGTAAQNFWNSFNHWHTFTFHMGMVAYWVWMLMLNIYQPEKRHIRKTVLLYTSFYFVTVAGAFIFHENYADVLSPSLAIFERFRLTAGQFAYDVGLLTMGIGIVFAVANLAYLITSKLYHHHLAQCEDNDLQIKQN